MKDKLNNWVSDVAAFLTGSPEVKVQSGKVSEWMHKQVAYVAPTRLEQETGEADPMLDQGSAKIADSMPKQEIAAHVNESAQASMPEQASVAPEMVTASDNGAELREQIEGVSKNIEILGDRLLKIEATLEEAGDGRVLLEEQEKIIRDLTTRLREATESQLINSIMGPVVARLIQLFDTVWSAKQDWGKQKTLNADEWIPNFLDVVEGEIMAMLNQYGVTMIKDTTNVLSPGKQRVVGTQSPKQVRDGEVLSVVRPGFVRNGRVERPEEVIVARTVVTGGVR